MKIGKQAPVQIYQNPKAEKNTQAKEQAQPEAPVADTRVSSSPPKRSMEVVFGDGKLLSTALKSMAKGAVVGAGVGALTAATGDGTVSGSMGKQAYVGAMLGAVGLGAGGVAFAQATSGSATEKVLFGAGGGVIGGLMGGSIGVYGGMLVSSLANNVLPGMNKGMAFTIAGGVVGGVAGLATYAMSDYGN